MNNKEVNSLQLEQIFKEFCNKNKYIYNEFYHNKEHKQLVLSFGEIENNWFGIQYVQTQCYCMSLNENNEFVSVINGLNKKLKGYKIIDIENIKKKRGG